MKKDLTQPLANALSTSFAEKLLSGIAESRASTVIAGGGKPFLRLLKSGEWVFGAANEEVQPGSQWAINVMSLAHGYCCWVETGSGQKNALRGEVMISMAEAKPLRPAPIDGTPYAEQRSFEAKCLTGADAGTEVLYKTPSIGGMRGIDDLLIEIQAQLSTPGGINHPCPVVEFEFDHYQHPKYGKTFVPILTVVGWADMEGRLAAESEAVDAPAEPVASKPASRVKPAKPSLKGAETASNGQGIDATLARGRTTPAQGAPVSTTQAHAGQRRRPVAR